jgi:hypothetical protein
LPCLHELRRRHRYLAHHRYRQLTCRRRRVEQRGHGVRCWQARGIETSDDWIVERTGIRARHFADDNVLDQ